MWGVMSPLCGDKTLPIQVKCYPSLLSCPGKSFRIQMNVDGYPDTPILPVLWLSRENAQHVAVTHPRRVLETVCQAHKAVSAEKCQLSKSYTHKKHPTPPQMHSSFTSEPATDNLRICPLDHLPVPQFLPHFPIQNTPPQHFL